MPLRAGVARVALDAPLGAAMMGYGLRTGVAEGRADPLFARALYLGGDVGEVLLVELDLCLIATSQADAVRAAVEARTGVPASAVAVACTHTHSGPETGFGALLGGVAAPGHVAGLLAGAEEAAVRAHAAAAPARLGLGRGEAHIGRNRRVADGPIDPRVRVLRVDGEDGALRAVLYLHGCHPTVRGHENRDYSADWPGAASRAVEAVHPGAVAIFGLCAHADVDPRTRGVMDLARTGQSVGAGPEAAEALGGEVADAVLGALEAIETRSEAAVGSARARLAIPIHGAADGAEAHAAALAAGRRDALAALELEADAEVGTGELFRILPERTAHLPDEACRERRARVRTYLRDRTAARFAGGLVPAVEVQVLRLGPLELLVLPLEPTVAVGRAWAGRRGPDAAVLGIGNGWLRYLPHPDDWAEPGSERFYEVLMSTLVPDAASRLLDAGERLASELAREVG